MFNQYHDEDEVVSSQEAAQAHVNRSTLKRTATITAIRDFVLANPGRILSIDDFKKAIGATTAPYYVRDLLRSGLLQRHKHAGRGHQYSYTWSGDPKADIDVASIDNNDAKQQMGTASFTNSELSTLSDLLQEWQLTAEEGDDESNLAQQQFGATKFVKWIHENRTHKQTTR